MRDKNCNAKGENKATTILREKSQVSGSVSFGDELKIQISDFRQISKFQATEDIFFCRDVFPDEDDDDDDDDDDDNEDEEEEEFPLLHKERSILSVRTVLS